MPALPVSVSADTPRRYLAPVVRPEVLTIVGLFLLWWVASGYFPPRDLPAPSALAELTYGVVSGADRFGFVEHTWVTLQRIALSFVISMVLGVTIGIVMGYRVAERYLTAPVMVFLTFPAVVWAFIGVMWFGITRYLVMVMVIVLVVTPYVIVNVWKGMGAIDRDLVEMGQAFDFPTRTTWQHVYIPHLAPFIFASGRLALALSWKLSLVAEIFGSTAGIGFVINYYFEAVRADMVLAWAVPLMVGMFLVERVLKRVEERAFAWRPELEVVHAE